MDRLYNGSELSLIAKKVFCKQNAKEESCKTAAHLASSVVFCKTLCGEPYNHKMVAVFFAVCNKFTMDWLPSSSDVPSRKEKAFGKVLLSYNGICLLLITNYSKQRVIFYLKNMKHKQHEHLKILITFLWLCYMISLIRVLCITYVIVFFTFHYIISRVELTAQLQFPL